MSWSLLATIVSICNGIVTFVKSIFAKKTDSSETNGPSVDEVNKVNKESADIARNTDASNKEEIKDAQVSTSHDVAAVHDASSLQAGSEDLNDAISRANGSVSRK